MTDSETEVNESDTLKQWKFKVNRNKTKAVAVREDLKGITTSIQISGTTIERVRQFCYLGSVIT